MTFYKPAKGFIKRTPRGPIYTDDELVPFFFEVAKGYSFPQATERCGYDWQKMHNTLYSDDETLAHALDLSIAAGGEIRAGRMEVPDRPDGLFDEYKRSKQ